jgi:hypothetical protein
MESAPLCDGDWQVFPFIYGKNLLRKTNLAANPDLERSLTKTKKELQQALIICSRALPTEFSLFD